MKGKYRKRKCKERKLSHDILKHLSWDKLYDLSEKHNSVEQFLASSDTHSKFCYQEPQLSYSDFLEFRLKGLHYVTKFGGLLKAAEISFQDLSPRTRNEFMFTLSENCPQLENLWIKQDCEKSLKEADNEIQTNYMESFLCVIQHCTKLKHFKIVSKNFLPTNDKTLRKAVLKFTSSDASFTRPVIQKTSTVQRTDARISVFAQFLSANLIETLLALPKTKICLLFNSFHGGMSPEEFEACWEKCLFKKPRVPPIQACISKISPIALKACNGCLPLQAVYLQLPREEKYVGELIASLENSCKENLRLFHYETAVDFEPGQYSQDLMKQIISLIKASTKLNNVKIGGEISSEHLLEVAKIRPYNSLVFNIGKILYDTTGDFASFSNASTILAEIKRLQGPTWDMRPCVALPEYIKGHHQFVKGYPVLLPCLKDLT